MSKKGLYVEQRPQGDFAVRKEGSKRASDVEPTQKEAIGAARKIAPDGESMSNAYATWAMAVTSFEKTDSANEPTKAGMV